MKSELTSLPALLLGGVNFYGDPFSAKAGWDAENEIGNTWRRFMALKAEAGPCARGGEAVYEVHIYGPETEKKGYFEVFVGEEVRAAQLPVSLSAKYIPASEYLRVTLSGEEITGDWWLGLEGMIAALGGYARNGGYILQVYDSRFLGMEQLGDSVLDAYIPVAKQDERSRL